MSCLPKVTLNYSINGTDFQAVGLVCELEIHNIFLDPFFDELPERDSGKLTQKSNPHIRVEMGITWDIFDPSGTGAAKSVSNWQFLQEWLCAPIRRIAWNTTLYATWGGYSTFNSGTNTNYVIIDDFEPEYVPSNLEVGITSLKLVKITAIVAGKYTLAGINLS